MNTAAIQELARQLKIGDLVFIDVCAKPFKMVSDATASWTNHVGIVVQADGSAVVIAESTFPFSKRTSLDTFINRSTQGRVAVKRPRMSFTAEQTQAIVAAADKRMGILYDTGFDLYSRRQFCSRLVYEVLQEAVGLTVGEVENFATLLQHNPRAKLGFWRCWYFGWIPWQRRTVTPASMLRSAQVVNVYESNQNDMEVAC
ncbi:YebB family permuted papain-like enzyme [Parvibium lacunae]|uniref:YebB family permuted papain-like enzyme n=1 Tax=Parvibium lacunae TaxID=1888893 RepID=A0A368L109_9BURK|nr:YebB family permuted papain-like enzyme [Parvibium lacunae]RCS57125.1 YebB family permuted papain-like enzyme [Parvibium lacunae]